MVEESEETRQLNEQAKQERLANKEYKQGAKAAEKANKDEFKARTEERRAENDEFKATERLRRANARERRSIAKSTAPHESRVWRFGSLVRSSIPKRRRSKHRKGLTSNERAALRREIMDIQDPLARNALLRRLNSL